MSVPLGPVHRLAEVDTRRQRCWVHKTANVLNKLPKSRQTAAKAALHDIWMADGRAEAERAMNTFAAKYDAKYPQAGLQVHDGTLAAAIIELGMISPVDQVEHDGARAKARAKVERHAVADVETGRHFTGLLKRRRLITLMPMIVPGRA